MKVKTKNLFLCLTLGTSALFFYSCATPAKIENAPSKVATPEKSGISKVASTPIERPGLGTGWGDEKRSKLRYTNFTRASKKPYGKVETIYYNDKEGVDAIAGKYRWGHRGLQKSNNGLVEWGIKQEGRTLKSYYNDGKRFIQAKNDRTYTILIKNVCHSRIEAVASVDGLDVINGRSASTKNQGYIIKPGKTLEIKGFRISEEEVAAFKFSSVNNSYSAEKYGTTRNVGVIGLAIFTQEGVEPWKWSTREIQYRESASPFAEAAR